MISAENLLIENTVMRDTAGTPPAAGIDFEPNHAGERLKNCVMRNCLTENNHGDGYEFYLPNLTAASEPVAIRLENCRSRGDRSALRVITGNAEADAVRGTMTVAACRQPGARPWIACQSGAEYETVADLSGTVALAAVSRISVSRRWASRPISSCTPTATGPSDCHF